VEELLAQTVNLAVSLKQIPAAALATLVVDSTVQEKAVAHPTDSKLLETAQAKLVQAAQSAGIELRQTFAKEARLLGFKAGRYAHAKHFKRMRRAIKRQSTVVGRLVREIERKASVLTERGVAVRQSLDSALAKASRAYSGERDRRFRCIVTGRAA
jgi:IS5 family transposase